MNNIISIVVFLISSCYFFQASSLRIVTPKPTNVINDDESDIFPSQKSTTTTTTESGSSVSSFDLRFRSIARKKTRPSSTESSKKKITVAPTVQFQSSENATYNTTFLPVDKKQLDDYSKEESNELNTWQVDEKEFNTRGLKENGNIGYNISSLSPSSTSDMLIISTAESMSTTKTSLTPKSQNEDNSVNQTTISIPSAQQNETVDNSIEESSNRIDIISSPVSSISEKNATVIKVSISISGLSKSSNSGALNNLNNFWLLVNLVSLSLILICLQFSLTIFIFTKIINLTIH